MIPEQIPFYLAFNSLMKLSTHRVHSLLDYFRRDARAAWEGSAEWQHILSPISLGNLQELLYHRSRLEPDRLYSEFLAAGCGLCVWGDPDYPPLLTEIFDPPLLLFYHGKLPRPEEVCVAMVGSRRYTPYGRQVASLFAQDLAEQGIIVVSGMARGIDSACHLGALKGGSTIAVLGSGLDVVYPRENAALYEKICSRGAVISEFPLGTSARPVNFPRRNRIISGLSRAVVVVEANEKSGTMVTVDFALEQGRDVFAVPGPITSPASRGTNRLIRDGARMALSPEDIRREYIDGPRKDLSPEKAADPSPGQSPTEERLLKKMLLPVQMDELAADPDLGLSVSELAACLTMLEIRGLVKQLPGKYYQTVVKRL